MNKAFRNPDNKTNVLFLHVQLEGMGGSERLIQNLASKLDRNYFNPSIAWFNGNKPIKEIRDLGIPLFHVPKKKRFDFTAMRKLGNIITDNNIHVVNAHHFMPMVYSFYGCKVMNSISLIYTEHSEWELERISWKWEKIGSSLLRHSDAAVGVNEGVTKLLEKKFKLHQSKARTILNGVEVGQSGDPSKSRLLRRQLGIQDDEKIIGIVANLRKIKNHIFLLKAFHMLGKEFQNVKLLIIGQGGNKGDSESTEQEIRNYVTERGLSGKVLLLGYRSDVSELLHIMDIFCLTSFKEGLPVGLLEAMAAGLPVIGTDVEGIRDVIIPNKNGFLVDIHDVKGLKNFLLALLKDESLRQMFSKESIALVKETYSLDRCVKQYQDLFMK